MNLLLLAIAPSLALGVLFYVRDRHDREPLGLLLKTFAWGAFTIVPVGVIESKLFKVFGIDIFQEQPLLMSLFSMIFLVAVVEEFAKFAVVRWYCWGKKAFNEPYDGIMYTLMASLGFATVENVLYVINYGETVAWLRAFLTVPMHGLTAVLMGYYLGLAKYPKDPVVTRYLLTGLAVAIGFHGLFNTFISSQWIGLVALAPVMVGYAWVLGFRASRLHAQNSPHKRGRVR